MCEDFWKDKIKYEDVISLVGVKFHFNSSIFLKVTKKILRSCVDQHCTKHKSDIIVCVCLFFGMLGGYERTLIKLILMGNIVIPTCNLEGSGIKFLTLLSSYCFHLSTIHMA